MTTLFCVILLPLLPAYLLFAALPGNAAVSGPLKGFRINLSGAFAGYFALVLLLISTLHILLPVPPRLKWTVTGQVVDSTTMEPIPLLDFTLNPPGRSLNEDGTFHVDFTADLADDGKNVKYPTLTILSAGYKAECVHLGQKSPRSAGNQPVVDGHLIKIGQIALTKQTAYVDPATTVSSTSGTP